jgi:hypothetical protein
MIHKYSGYLKVIPANCKKARLPGSFSRSDITEHSNQNDKNLTPGLGGQFQLIIE